MAIITVLIIFAAVFVFAMARISSLSDQRMKVKGIHYVG